MASNGSRATAASQEQIGTASWPASGVIDGCRDDTGWGAGHGWASKGGEPLPQWLEVDFGRERCVQRFVIITYQKENSAETAGKWGVQNYTIEAWDKRKQKWKAIAGSASEFPGKVRVHQLAKPVAHGSIPNRGHQSRPPRRTGKIAPGRGVGILVLARTRNKVPQ